MSAGQVILSANDSSPQASLGQVHTNFDLEGLLGPRAYVYVRNHDSSAWTKGLAVRQRSDLFATEGTALTGDANTVVGEIADASGPGAPFTTAGYIPDTLDKALYWQASASPTSQYYGRVYRNTSDIKFLLEDQPAAAITNSGAYIIWKPFTFIKAGVDDTLSIGGVTQANISAGYYGFVQFAGFGYAYLVGNATANGDGLGNIPGGTAGYGKGVTAGTSDGYVYCYNLTDNSAAALYAPVMISCPYMRAFG